VGYLSIFVCLCLLYHNRRIYSRKPLILQRIPAIFQGKKQGIGCLFSSACSPAIVLTPLSRMPLRIFHPVSWLPLNFSHSAPAFQEPSAAPPAARRIFLSLSRFPSLYRRGFRLYFTKQNASANSKLINNDTFRNSHVILSFIPIPPRVSHFAICRTIAAVSGSSLIISIYVKPFYSSISLKSSAILSKCVDTPKSASCKESTVSVSVFLLSN